VLTVGTLGNLTHVTGGGLTIANGGDVNLTGALTYNATSGNSLNITSNAGNITGSGSELLDTTTAGGGNIVLTALHDIGTSANRIHIGNTLNGGAAPGGGWTNGLVLNSTSTPEGGKEYINKAGALNLVGINNVSNNASLGHHSLTNIIATGAVSQSGDIKMGTAGDLVIKTLNTPGADILLKDPNNTVGTVDLLSRNAGDTANASGQLAFYSDNNGFSVVEAAGGGITFHSTGKITLSTASLGTPAALNIDAGSGDIALSTTGNIEIDGPGQLLAHNITLDLASVVTFSGGVPSNPNYVATQNNDLVVKATGNITINADVFNVVGGKVVGSNSAPIGPAGTPLRSSNAIIDAGGILKITTIGDFNVVGGGSQVGGVVGGGPGGVTFNGGSNNTGAQANAFLKANTLDLTVGGDFYMTGGKVTQTGAASTATGSASAIIEATNGKQIKVNGNMYLTGGVLVNPGTSQSSATAEIGPVTQVDPFETLNLDVGKNLILQSGSGPGLNSASIVNTGQIIMTIGKKLPQTSGNTVVVNGHSYDAGIIVIGGPGSGRFDRVDNPLTQNAYPISWSLLNGGQFTIDTRTMGASASDAFMQSLAPRGIDPGLLGPILHPLDPDKSNKPSQGNFKQEAESSCN
jgi:hypothetical protein